MLYMFSFEKYTLNPSGITNTHTIMNTFVASVSHSMKFDDAVENKQKI